MSRRWRGLFSSRVFGAQRNIRGTGTIVSCPFFLHFLVFVFCTQTHTNIIIHSLTHTQLMRHTRSLTHTHPHTHTHWRTHTHAHAPRYVLSALCSVRRPFGLVFLDGSLISSSQVLVREVRASESRLFHRKFYRLGSFSCVRWMQSPVWSLNESNRRSMDELFILLESD